MVRNKSGGNTPVSRAVFEKMQYYDRWLSTFTDLALGRFKWKNVPDSLDPRFLEWVLLQKDHAVFFEVDGDLMATDVIFRTAGDMYGNHHEYTAIGANGWTYDIPNDEGVVIWSSMSRMPKWPALHLGIDEVAETQALARVNRRQQRIVTLLSGPAEAAADLAQLARDLEMGESSRVTTSDFTDKTNVAALSTNVKYLQKEFHEDVTAQISDIYLSLGIDTIPFQKQAHIIESEAQKSSDSVMTIRDGFLKVRKQAADEVNKKFGTKIEVEWNDIDRPNPEELVQEVDRNA